MELEGSLKTFPLPEVLQFLAMGKMSGLLHLDRSDLQITLTIKGGRIVNSSTLHRSRRLGELLVQRGHLRRRHLEDILSRQQILDSGKRLGQILAERGLVTERDLADTLRLQVEEEVWDLFSWSDGHFKFENGEESKITDIAVQIDIEPLLLEGSRRQDEWKKIRETITSDSIVFELVPLGDDFRRTLKLSPLEWRVLSGVNGLLSVEGIMLRCGIGRFETCHILHSFLQQEIVRIVPKPFLRRMESGAERVPEIIAERARTLAAARNPDAGGAKGIGALFGARPKTNERTGIGDIAIPAPVSLMGTLVNAFTQYALQQKEFVPRPEDARLLETLWNEVLMQHPQADLVRVVDNWVDTTTLEAYLEKSDFAQAVQDCHEEAVEAVVNLLKIVYSIAAQRMGEKTIQKVLQSFIEAASGAQLRYAAKFDLAWRCNRALGLAAA